jgi:hypothetical protein
MSRIDGNITFSKNLHGETGVIGNNDLKLKRDYFRLQILFNQILYIIKPPLVLYSDGDFDEYIATMPNLLLMSTIVNNDNTYYYNDETQLDNRTIFSYDENLIGNYRGFTNELMNTLKQNIATYYKCKNIEAENVELKTYKEILNDPQQLSDYLRDLKNTRYLFSASATLSTPAQIKPWYLLYLERHGPPGDGVFDTALLAAIIDELVAAGQVSPDEIVF